jgi:hypothetical protein
MEKKQLAVVVAVVGVFCSAALAGAPLGPPRSLVEHGQWAVNFEYGHEEIDLYTYGTWDYRDRDWDPSAEEWLDWSDWECDGSGVMEIRDLEADMWMGSLEYGLCDRWEVFIRLGIADAQDEVEPVECGAYDVDEIYNFDGDYGFAWGAGTKMTICQHGDWTFGGVIQMTFLYPDESDLTWGWEDEGGTGVVEGEGDLELRQFQAGIGATLDLSSMLDGWFAYGGICWLYMRGDMDVDLTVTRYASDETPVIQAGSRGDHDVAEQGDIGGWVGLGCHLETVVCFAEAQILEDYWLVGGGVKIPLP